MLVLSRTAGQEIRIGADIVVKVLKTSTGRCKIGIEAAPHVSIVRSECARLPATCERRNLCVPFAGTVS